MMTQYERTGAHCSGSQRVDDSPIAVLPVPVVAFVIPYADLHEFRADDHLKRCGDLPKLINRKVEVNRTACIPAGLTRIITLGIWQWCPANVSWEADVKSSGQAHNSIASCARVLMAHLNSAITFRHRTT